MRRKFLAFLFILVPASIPLYVQPAQAQVSSGISSGPARSDGLSASLVKVIVGRDSVTAQIEVTNNTQARVYLTDARVDGAQKAFLGSGEHLLDPFPAGMPFCNGDYSGCVKNPYDMDLTKFSYLEPGDTLGLSMRYGALLPVRSDDSITFALVLIARKAAVGRSPSDAGPPEQVRFNFRFIQLSAK